MFSARGSLASFPGRFSYGQGTRLGAAGHEISAVGPVPQVKKNDTPIRAV